MTSVTTYRMIMTVDDGTSASHASSRADSCRRASRAVAAAAAAAARCAFVAA